MAVAISGISFLRLNRPPQALDVQLPSDQRVQLKHGAHTSQACQSDVHYSHIPGDQAGIKEEPLTICFCGDAAIRPDGVPEERGHALLIPAPPIWVGPMPSIRLGNKISVCFRARLDTSCWGLFPTTTGAAQMERNQEHSCHSRSAENRPVSLRACVSNLPILAHLKHLAPQEVLYLLVAEFTSCFPSLTLAFPQLPGHAWQQVSLFLMGAWQSAGGHTSVSHRTRPFLQVQRVHSSRFHVSPST